MSILLKRQTGDTATPSNLTYGEVALNKNGILFNSTEGGTANIANFNEAFSQIISCTQQQNGILTPNLYSSFSNNVQIGVQNNYLPTVFILVFTATKNYDGESGIQFQYGSGGQLQIASTSLNYMNGEPVKEDGYKTGNLVAILCYKNVNTPTEMTTVLLGGGGGGAENSIVYTAQLLTSSWAGSSETGYTQTSSCVGMTDETICAPPWVKPTGNKDTDIAIRQALGYIDVIDTGNEQITATCYRYKPETDIIIYLVPAQGNTLPPVGLGTVRSVNGIPPDGIGNVNIFTDLPQN